MVSSVKILVTGGSGQVAWELGAKGGTAVRVVGRPDFDFDRPETIAEIFRTARPSAVVNAAAYTAVDAAETNQDAAYRANRDGPAMLAKLCQGARIPLVHISTDYVFDGRKGAPYVETDPVGPTGVYGASKLAGEQGVLAECEKAVVLRTAWVYAPRGHNFLLTMLSAAKKTNRLRVVADQRGSPTAAEDLASAILSLPFLRGDGWRNEYRGIFHAAASGETTWHGLACAIFEEAARDGAAPPLIEPITTADWPTPAKRPPDSRLDCTKLARLFGLRLPDWRDGVRRTVARVFSPTART
ncbi:MAG: dTDP-4-dehydrorhamnose reductase [Acetobacteraceae bacterium]|nr:dTDP-4-dehydrorhamnose reductase [Acetobacteraceae bacterium]